ncbi:hypothetical protein [Paraburkholderia monticola]|uniref:hypothetical protein n=1 Tax=Paraburkholderia monticola TaxID=1399968 RepID=UPI000AAEA726|nr:hypothetical protein [Paraburkholderia monticola]
MIQTMLATIGAPVAPRDIEAQRQAVMLRKVMGFAIVASGFAVIAAQALQHALGA